MGDFDFLIPLSLDALREAQSTRQYAVNDVYTASEIPKKIQECQVVFRQDGPKFILNARHFDTIYSVLVHFDAVDEEFRIRAWELLIKAMAKVTADLALRLDEEAMGSRDKLEWLNILKMTTYLACTLMECFEKFHLKPSTDTLDLGKKKKGQKKTEYGIDWEEERNRMLLQLFSILHHPLQRLWEPPVVEEDYVNLIANCCYKILETPSMNLVRSKASRDSIFQVLGMLVKKFNHGLACSLKLMQLLQHFEHLVGPVASGVVSIMEDFGNTAVLSELVREIAKIDHRDMAKDSSGMRNYSQFLVEVSERSPQVIMPSLSLLINFLDEEFYGLRNCVLAILGSIVLRVLNGEQLDQKNKDLRDQCLDLLEEHLHDIHAFVRSKVLGVWQELVVEKAVPLARQKHVMSLVLGRLKDKSSNVRKHAIQLLTAFLKGNPFAAKLPLEELEMQLKEEKAKLHEMAPELAAEEEGRADENKPRTPRDMWLTVLPLVIRDVCDIVTEDTEDMDEEDSLASDVTLNSAVSEVASALNANKFVRATKLLRAAFEVFDGSPVFQTTEDQMNPKIYEDETDDELNEEQIKYLVILERIFLSSKAMEQKKQGEEDNDEGDKKDKQQEEEANQKEADPEENKEKEEVTKQKMLVNYLKDSVAFSQVIHNALPIVCQMLASKQVSDVMEAVQFFVTAFEFGLLNAMSGVRRMLSLVWSKEQNIKDAVVEAYQRLYINVDAPNDRVRSQHIVRNLSALITGATLGERTSMEEIVAQFVNTGDINKNCVTLLWERFTKAIPETSDDDARSALVLLAMCANSEDSIVKSNIPVLVMCGLGERGEKDFALVKETCQALLKMASLKPKTESEEPPYRLNCDHDIFVRLCDILVKGLNNLEDHQYSPMAIECISTIYSLIGYKEIIRKFELFHIWCICEKRISRDSSENNLENGKAGPIQGRGGSPPIDMGLQNVPMGVLSRFFVVVGHMAIRQLIHLDSHIFSELKRRNYIKELHQEERMKNKKNKKSKKRKSLATSALEAQKELSGSQQSTTTGGEDIEEEMGLTGAVADDMEAEYIRNVCETEIITGDNLLSFIRPLIWSVCSNPSKYPDPGLQTAATLALSKFMMVSSEVCEDNLQLLFTILEKSEEPVIRANVVIALGDLSFRFPNQTEPWTPKIYARLRDHCPMVRRNTLTVLTHLILNDMIKVKGQISDIALCVTDDDNRIMGFSRILLYQINHKHTSVYANVIYVICKIPGPSQKSSNNKYTLPFGCIF
ncbi:unnamed protein product, partial [Meganyctiphanes norvegica]